MSSSAPLIARRTFFAAAASAGALVLAACTTGPGPRPSTPGPTPTRVRPAVTGLSPATGSLAGGTTVTIEGTGLGTLSGAAFGTEPGTAFTVVDDAHATVVAPASLNFVEGPVAVTLQDAAGATLTAPQQFSYAVVTAVDKQMQYAFTYWQNYNTAEWGVFTGDDCGNFVNQTLVARGWQMSNAWYNHYSTTGGYSLSWVRGTPMFDYLNAHPQVTHYAVDQRDNVKVGDVVMFDWDPQNGNGVDHTMVVSKVAKGADGHIAIACVGHTTDYQYRDLDNAITVEYPGATAHFFSIAA